MGKFLNQLIDKASEFFASRKGLLPSLGITFVIANFIMQFYPSTAALADMGLFLHLGVILAVIGMMLAWAL